MIEHLKDDMTYKRMTEADRRQIHRWRQEGDGLRELARRLGRAASSISRELSRNTGGRGYRPKQAHEQAQKRALRPGPRRFTDEVRAAVELRLKKGWTPELISGRAKLEGRAMVCKESIYQQIYCDAKAGGDLWTYLPRARRKRRRRCPRQAGRGRGKIPNQRMIDTRPAEVETRKSVGHWEGDLIIGQLNQSCIGTLVERKTGFLVLCKMENKSAAAVREGFERQFKKIDSFLRLSMTYDRGSEMAEHPLMSKHLKMAIYFADPHAPWQRGSNENINGLLRQYFPKGSDLSGVSQVRLNDVAWLLNTRPRKRFDFQTPQELFDQATADYLNHVALDS